jgi:hypothetical protein
MFFLQVGAVNQHNDFIIATPHPGPVVAGTKRPARELIHVAGLLFSGKIKATWINDSPCGVKCTLSDTTIMDVNLESVCILMQTAIRNSRSNKR